MSSNIEAPIRKAAAADLVVGLICADRDGNRIRIDTVDRGAARISYHFLNDELRVQEGIQEVAIDDFVVQGWSVGVSGRL